MIALLSAIGRRARWVLAFGVFGALFLGPISSVLRPILPLALILTYAVSIMRIDPAEVLRDALSPRAIVRNLTICAILMLATPALLFFALEWAGAPAALLAPIVYIGAAPAVGSAPALCFLLGLDAAIALQVTILSGMLAPLLGPIVSAALLGEAAPLDPTSLALRLALMIGSGAAIALAARRWLTPAWIDAKADAMNGASALLMLLFLAPVFDGVGAMILDAPSFALLALLLVFVVNFGLQAAAAAAFGPILREGQPGAVGIMAGNRNVGLYLAAVPFDPVLSLVVALYQYPMFLTPLVMPRFLGRRAAS